MNGESGGDGGRRNGDDGLSDYTLLLFAITFTAAVTVAIYLQERVIESVTYEEAGYGKCVHYDRNPAKRSFGRGFLECGGY